MKSVTITMEDSVADWAWQEAARRNTSVSRLVGELLTEKMHLTDRHALAMNQALRFRPIDFASPYLTREDVYAERLDRLC